MDRHLVERAQHGDHDAFDKLATEAFPRLWSIARRVTGDHHLAEDAVQDCLVRAWRNLRALRDPERLDAWLYRLLVNACRDQGRATRRSAGDVVTELQDVADEYDGSVHVELRDQLDRGFARLTVEHRAALVLHHVLGLRSREIAAVLGIPEGTVVSRLHYALRAMRRELEADLKLEADLQLAPAAPRGDD